MQGCPLLNEGGLHGPLGKHLQGLHGVALLGLSVMCFNPVLQVPAVFPGRAGGWFCFTVIEMLAGCGQAAAATAVTEFFSFV